MSFQTTSVSTRIAPIGTYNPLNRYSTTPAPLPAPSNGGGFFSDVWAGTKAQLGADVNTVLHPVQTVENVVHNPGSLFSPFIDAVKSGHPGVAVGRLLATVGLVGGVVLGGRALLGAGNGAATVGTGANSTGILSKVGGFFGSIAHGIGSAVSGIVHGIGSLFGGGAASVGFN